MPTDWTWTVTLDDGTECSHPQPGGFWAIPSARIRSLIVHDGSGQSDHIHVLHLRNGMRPIFNVRRSRSLDPSTDEIGEPMTVVTYFGYQETIRGRNRKTLIWLWPDGSVSVTDRDIDELDNPDKDSTP